jgi:Dolichyl-phosphate-mannose-protein mannosyltransferase
MTFSFKDIWKNVSSHPYFTGWVLFFVSIVLMVLTYQDYGVSWDEPAQRNIGVMNYNLAKHDDKTIFTDLSVDHGASFELLLIKIEHLLRVTDPRDIYLMRHLVTHFLFLVSALAGYYLIYKLFRRKLLAAIGFIMLAFNPRIYAHSYFNTKDLPFLLMFTITFAICQAAFEKRKFWLFLLLGISAGFMTAIRAMGVMYLFFILLIFVFNSRENFEFYKKKFYIYFVFLLLFFAGFCGTLVGTWPVLWFRPLEQFLKCFGSLSHYSFTSNIVLNGQLIPADHLPWYYVPQWFCMSTPVFWLVCGFGGILLLVFKIVASPIRFFANTRNRTLFIFLLCFLVPVASVIKLHSVLYDDWRHLYFIYPSFVVLSIYFLNTLFKTKLKIVVFSLTMLQFGMVGYFEIKYHPFQQVYFNELVRHDEEFLRHNFDYEYWGCGFHQALQYILVNDKRDHIRLRTNSEYCLNNNIDFQKREDRGKFIISDISEADYFITNFRDHPNDYTFKNLYYSIKVQNSTVLAIYKIDSTDRKNLAGKSCIFF